MWEYFKNIISFVTKGAWLCLGAFWAYFEPIYIIIGVCFGAVLIDVFTAWRLSKRVHKYCPSKSCGKFKSNPAKRVFSTIIQVSAMIMLAFAIDKNILTMEDIYLTKIVAGVFCFIQIWSILENESSFNPKSWAKLLQKIMIDKAERHFDVDLSDFKKDEKDKNKPNATAD
ncbi:MAG: phage holin family protein [Prevotellaceae bacterium]|jgi:hypothetical protein|nr:phage holin family protein [Prevotellaceae bacterium]